MSLSAIAAPAIASFGTALVPTAVALGVALLLFLLERRQDPQAATVAPFAALPPLAGVVVAPGRATFVLVPLVVGLAVAMMARNRRDLLHSECGLKLLWVLGPALALSWAGMELLTLSTGTSVFAEQWAVLQLGLEPRFLWSTALPLSLLTGVVLLGAAPFHFWMADLFHGARAWLAPLTAAAFQVMGAVWLARRLTGIEAFPSGAEITGPMLAIASVVAFIAGAATLLGQRRPERRVGTLASLQGGLMLAALAAAHGREDFVDASRAMMGPWATHLALAYTGASILARFLPVAPGLAAPGATLFRRHPVTALVGALPLLSLAGVPGTPGALVWLDTASTLAATGHSGVLAALAVAWLAAFATAIQQLREGFGIPAQGQPPERPTPWVARGALWIAALGLAAMGVAWMGRGSPS
jgi:NADH:ubiquinone oxidoreductase subunit 2 (subunit N)